MTADDWAILELAAQPLRHAGTRDAQIRDLGLTPTAFYARLNRIIDMPEALAAQSVLVNRLRRMRERRLAG